MDACDHIVWSQDVEKLVSWRMVGEEWLKKMSIV
jgi:hypothetical protein